MYVATCFRPAVAPVSVLRFIWMLIKITENVKTVVVCLSPTHLIVTDIKQYQIYCNYELNFLIHVFVILQMGIAH